MKFKRIFSTLFLCFVLGLLASSSWFLLHPVRASEATCTANCEGRPSVTCTGNGGCEATDNLGCTYVQNGQAKSKLCSSSGDDKEISE